MIIGINAINIRAGGGITHLYSLLSLADPQLHGFTKIIIWGNSSVLEGIENKDWLVKVCPPNANRSLFSRVFWQFYHLKNSLNKHECDILFCPGGSDFSYFRPVVGMSQNMLPFEFKELIRYGFSFTTLKFLVLHLLQSNHFKKADGVIFLSKYAKNKITKIVAISGLIKIIPHGISPVFKANADRPLNKDFDTSQIRLLYISNIEYYKHQWNVVEAVARLKKNGLRVSLDLVGVPIRGVSRLIKSMNQFDPSGSFIQFHGEKTQIELSKMLNGSDIFIFASSCENLPITLLEAMSTGIPIACSNKGPMPEILGDAGVYFNPLDVSSISSSILSLCHKKKLCIELSQKAIVRSAYYKWGLCVNETFQFLSEVKQAHEIKK